ncbi:MAG: SRPBCC domain-containing protein [Planctomycetota bacterium]|nr:SRPBCC domain-containing protein [Planctomycetota bacterium]
MPSIHHEVGVRASVSDVYAALTTDEGLAAWWTTDTTGSGAAGSTIRFRFHGQGPDFLVTELIPGELVRWQCFGGGPEAWIGTEVSFRLRPSEGQVSVRFRHSGWAEETDFLAHCSTKWAVFLLSLKDLLETGTGRPFPRDMSINHS